MMMKLLLLIVVMFFAMGLAAVLLRRMMSISERIGELHNDIKKNQVQLDSQLKVLEAQQRNQQIQENTENLAADDIEEKNS